jgi:hypothetical protein
MTTPRLEPTQIVDWTDEQLDEAFRRADTLPLDGLANSGEHQVDVAHHEIYNDQNWKGYLPTGLLLRDMAAQLSQGYAKRFWKQGGRMLGETIYLNGAVLLKHELEEVVIDRPTNDLAPGPYILLRYTDPVFEHIFYDVMKAVAPDLILYRGYSGRFPEGRRGWTAPLMRRFSFAQMGMADHAVLFSGGSMVAEEDLQGSWRLDAVANSNQLTALGRLEIARGDDRRLRGVWDATTANHDVVVPRFVAEHFQGDDLPPLLSEMRKVDRTYIVGKWTTPLRGPYARLQAAGSPGLFHVEKRTRGGRQFTLHYVLTRI